MTGIAISKIGPSIHDNISIRMKTGPITYNWFLKTLLEVYNPRTIMFICYYCALTGGYPCYQKIFLQAEYEAARRMIGDY